MQREAPTRVKILEAIKQDGPQPVRALSAYLDITAMAVRQHLVTLERDGLVRRQSNKRPVGRPENVFGLTAAAQVYFPQRHHDLACDLLEQARRTLGARGLERLLQARLEDQLSSYGPRLRDKQGAARLEELAAIQTENGFMASFDAARGEIVQRNCSICVAVQRCPELCAQEQRLFEGLLGARVERVQHVLNGDSVCRYRIVNFDPEATP